MSELNPDDLGQVLSTVRAVSQAQGRDAFLKAALRGVVSLCPCLVATINEVDPIEQRLAFWAEPELFPFPEGAAARFAELAPQHPLVRHYAETGDGSARRMSDFLSTEEFHASRLYQEVYRAIGVEFQIAITLPAPRPIVLGIVCNRADADFSERDVAVMNALRPHFVQAWQNARDHEWLTSLLDASDDALPHHRFGVVLVGEPPEEISAGALATLLRYFPDTGRDRLPKDVTSWIATQMAETGSLEINRPLTREIGDTRLVLRYLPAQRSRPGAIVVREETLRSEQRGFERLGMTPREAEIVELVTRGESNASIARHLTLAPGTVKKHLDNVYAKLGVRGRGPLTAFVLGISSGVSIGE